MVDWDKTPWNAGPGELPSDHPEEEPEEDDGLATWHTYTLFTNGDGSISGDSATNDNLDRGYPTECATWAVSYPDYQTMLKRTGGTHIGCSGVRVTVTLDGKEVSR